MVADGFIGRTGCQFIALGRADGAAILAQALGHTHAPGLLAHQDGQRTAVIQPKTCGSDTTSAVPVGAGFASIRPRGGADTVPCRQATGADTVSFGTNGAAKIGLDGLLGLAERMKDAGDESLLLGWGERPGFG